MKNRKLFIAIVIVFFSVLVITGIVIVAYTISTGKSFSDIHFSDIFNSGSRTGSQIARNYIQEEPLSELVTEDMTTEDVYDKVFSNINKRDIEEETVVRMKDEDVAEDSPYMKLVSHGSSDTEITVIDYIYNLAKEKKIKDEDVFVFTVQGYGEGLLLATVRLKDTWYEFHTMPVTDVEDGSMKVFYYAIADPFGE